MFEIINFINFSGITFLVENCNPYKCLPIGTIIALLLFIVF